MNVQPTDSSSETLPGHQQVLMMYSADRDESVGLFEIVETLWRGKWMIAAVTLGFAVAGTAFAIFATPIYKVEVVLAANIPEERSSALPGGLGGLANLAGINLGSSRDATEAVATLRSRAFIEEFISDKDLMPILFADDWDAANMRWKERDPESQPDIRDGVELFIEDVRSVVDDVGTGLVTFSIQWSDPDLAAQWAEELVDRINGRMRARDIADSQRRLKYLYSELDKATLGELRQAISQLIQNEIQIITVAQAESEYAFKVIDPPRAPKEPESPQRALIVVLAILLGGAVGCVAVMVRAAVQKHRRASLNARGAAE